MFGFRGFALLQVQKSLRERRVCDAVGMYRAARELWSDGMFGELDIDPEDEFVELREIFYAELVEIEGQYKQAMKEAYGRGADVAKGDEEVPSVSDSENKPDEDAEDGYNELDDEGENPYYQRYTIPFNFDEYVAYFAKHDVISWYDGGLRTLEVPAFQVCVLAQGLRAEFPRSEPGHPEDAAPHCFRPADPLQALPGWGGHRIGPPNVSFRRRYFAYSPASTNSSRDGRRRSFACTSTSKFTSSATIF